MALPISTVVAGISPAASGATPQQIYQDNLGALGYAKMHGDYYESTLRQRVFSGSTLTGVTTTVGFATTLTGMCLTNPVGSGKNIVLRRIKYGVLVAQTAGLVFGIQTGYNVTTAVTQTTPLVAANNFVGGATGVGLIASAVTMPTAPTRLILLDTLLTGAITVGVLGGNQYELADSIIIPPGGYAATYTSAASVASSLVFGMVWEEISNVT